MAKPKQSVRLGPIEKMRANVPLWGALATALSVLIMVGGFAWKASDWFSHIDRRIERVEVSVTAMTDQMANAQTKSEAYIACLESERANPRSYKCPMAPPPAKIARAAPKKAPPKEEPGTWGFLTLPAFAGWK